MNESTLISVIIPVYNAENYIERCVGSIQENTYKNIEIICVDDGSTDCSYEFLSEMQKKDDRILVIRQENQGVSTARNTGLKMAGGGWIGFVDADDWVHRDYFEILISAAQESDIVHCGAITCHDKEEDLPQTKINKTVIPAEKGYQNYAVKSFVWGKLFKREILEGLYFARNIKMAEDKVFVLQALKKARNITVLENKLYYYFKSPNSATQIVGLDMLPAGKELLKIAQETNNTYVLHDAYTAFLAHRYLNMFKEDYVSVRKTTNECLRSCKLLAKKVMLLKERVLLNLFVDVPLLYRWWRLMGDHTLVEWERSQRKKRR